MTQLTANEANFNILDEGRVFGGHRGAATVNTAVRHLDCVTCTGAFAGKGDTK